MGDKWNSDFTRRETKLVETCHSGRSRLADDRARQHLCEGFQRRLLLNQSSRFRIDEIAEPDRTSVLDLGLTAELNVHLNSFYVHIRGALDNLAWWLHYEFAVLGDGDEDDPRTRNQCGLFHESFLKNLEQRWPDLGAFLRSKVQWSKDFKELRDPVAHRVPLFAMPGVIREGSPEAQRSLELQGEMNRAIASGEIDQITGLMFESFRVGTYEPWFTQYGPKEIVVRDLKKQIATDWGEFLDIAKAVLRMLPASQ